MKKLLFISIYTICLVACGGRNSKLQQHSIEKCDIDVTFRFDKPIITDELKMFYYRGLREWPRIKEYLRDTCLTAQDNYKAVLDYFKIKY